MLRCSLNCERLGTSSVVYTIEQLLMFSLSNFVYVHVVKYLGIFNVHPEG